MFENKNLFEVGHKVERGFAVHNGKMMEKLLSGGHIKAIFIQQISLVNERTSVGRSLAPLVSKIKFNMVQKGSNLLNY